MTRPGCFTNSLILTWFDIVHSSLWRVWLEWLVTCDTLTLETSSAPQNPIFTPLSPDPTRTSLYYSQCLLSAWPFFGVKQTLAFVEDCSFSSSSSEHSFPFGIMFVPPCSAARHAYVIACSCLSWCQPSLLCGLNSAYVPFALLGFLLPFTWSKWWMHWVGRKRRFLLCLCAWLPLVRHHMQSKHCLDPVDKCCRVISMDVHRRVWTT